MTSETNPKLVAAPRSKFARKSETPMKIKTGISDFSNFPTFRNLMTKIIVNMKVVALIMTIVISALDSEPIDIKVNAVPKPAAAPSASNIGLGDKP